MNKHHRNLPWAKAVRIMENMFKSMGIDSFSNVTMGGGRAHQAFSTEDKAILIQSFLGEENVLRQCQELRLLKKALQESEKGNAKILPALYFPDDACKNVKLGEVARITPRNMASFRRYFVQNDHPH